MGQLKIYNHVRANASIKIKVNGQEQMIKFRNGRKFSNSDEERTHVVMSSFDTTNTDVQKAIESRSDYGKTIFAAHKIDTTPVILPSDYEYTVYTGVDTINSVKNTLKKEYTDKVIPGDLISPEKMLLFCSKVGAAFPEFFKQHEKFKAIESKLAVEDEESDEEEFDGDLDIVPSSMEDETTDEAKEEEIEFDREELMKKKRGDLDQFAADLGVRSPETYPNKGSLIDEIEKLAQ
jgi:hypothetical protein